MNNNVVEVEFGKSRFEKTVEAFEKSVTDEAPAILEDLNSKETHEEGKAR